MPQKKDNKTTPAARVELLEIAPEEAGQRLDNFLKRVRPGVPKTRIYRAIRKGEVRINRSRCKPDARLMAGDQLRIPPLQATERAPATGASQWRERLRRAILLEEQSLLAIDKPSGLAVHGGSGVSVGLIETLRSMYADDRYLELVHRLDRDTSGVILVARRAATLRTLHEMLRSDGMDKRYLCLVSGRWPAHLKQVDAPLEKFSLASGERRVKVSGSGRRALTQFRVVQRLAGATLMEAKPVTGRTHQIRVHCQHAGFPILGDVKYAGDAADELTRQLGVKRLFLHAHQLNFTLDSGPYELVAPLPHDLQSVLDGGS